MEASEERFQLSPEERQRMTRLGDEVTARLTEMGLIVGRALGRKPEVVSAVQIKRPGGRAHMEVIIGPGGSFGCYIDPPGKCYPC